MRITPLALVKYPHDERMKIRAAGTDADAARFTTTAAAHADRSVFDLFEDDAGLLEQELSSIRQLHAPRQTTEQGRSQFLLQLSNLRAQRRLIDAQFRGRAREIQLLRDRNEVA